jgi:hypothetical protein
MNRMRGSRRAFSRPSLVLLTVLAGCAREHTGPAVGDSITNWLAVCSSDGECRGDARCRSGVCSVDCSSERPETCAALGERAVCDMTPRICDVPCDATSACLALGPDHVCQEGHCRGGVSTSSGWSRTIPKQIEFEPGASEVSWTSANLSERSNATFARDEAFALSGDSASAVAPLATWQDDHFRVVWSSGVNDPGARLGIAEIDPAGQFEVRRLEVDAPIGLRTYKGDRDLVAQVGKSDETPNVCSLRVTDLSSGQTNTPLYFPCASMPAVVPVPESHEWLVTWPAIAGGAAGEQLAMRVSRYDPRTSAWSAGPWEIDYERLPYDYEWDREYHICAAGGDAWVWPLGEGGIHRLHDLAQPGATASPFVPRVDSWRPELGGSRQIVEVTDGVLLMEWTSSTGHTATIDHASTRVEGDEMSLPLPRKTARIAEKGLLAACVVHEGVTLNLLDERGTPVGGPVQIETSLKGADNAYTRLIISCDVAWSGSELVVVWGTIEGASQGPGQPASIHESPTVTRVYGRIVPLPVLSAVDG